MKILRINTTISKGGAALSALNIHESVINAGVDSWFLTARDSRNSKHQIISLGESKTRRAVNVLAYRLLGIEGFTNRKLWNPVLSKLDNFDVVHLHNIHGYYMPFSVLKKLLKKPCIWTLHDFHIVTGGPGSPVLEKRRKGLERYCPWLNLHYPAEWVDRSVNRRKRYFNLIKHLPPTFVALSKPMSERLITLGLRDQNIVIIPHGIFTKTNVLTSGVRKDARRKMSWPIGKHIFLFVAAQVDNPVKGFAVLLSALKSLVTSDAWVLYVVGDRYERFYRKVSSFNGDIYFLGSLSLMEINQCFLACDTYVAPTFSETFGRTIIEALGNGAEVVCSDLPVLRWLSGGRASFFPPGDVCALKSKLENKLNIGKVESDQSRYENASAIRQRFSRERMAYRYVRLYEKKLKGI